VYKTNSEILFRFFYHTQTCRQAGPHPIGGRGIYLAPMSKPMQLKEAEETPPPAETTLEKIK